MTRIPTRSTKCFSAIIEEKMAYKKLNLNSLRQNLSLFHLGIHKCQTNRLEVTPVSFGRKQSRVHPLFLNAKAVRHAWISVQIECH